MIHLLRNLLTPSPLNDQKINYKNSPCPLSKVKKMLQKLKLVLKVLKN
jgi:hypothetical protein